MYLWYWAFSYKQNVASNYIFVFIKIFVLFIEMIFLVKHHKIHDYFFNYFSRRANDFCQLHKMYAYLYFINESWLFNNVFSSVRSMNLEFLKICYCVFVRALDTALISLNLNKVYSLQNYISWYTRDNMATLIRNSSILLISNEICLRKLLYLIISFHF